MTRGLLVIPTRPSPTQTPPSPEACGNLGRSFPWRQGGSARLPDAPESRLPALPAKPDVQSAAGLPAFQEKRQQPNAAAVSPQQVASSMGGLSGAGTRAERTASGSANVPPTKNNHVFFTSYEIPHQLLQHLARETCSYLSTKVSPIVRQPVRKHTSSISRQYLNPLCVKQDGHLVGI